MQGVEAGGQGGLPPSVITMQQNTRLVVLTLEVRQPMTDLFVCPPPRPLMPTSLAHPCSPPPPAHLPYNPANQETEACVFYVAHVKTAKCTRLVPGMAGNNMATCVPLSNCHVCLSALHHES